MYVCYIYTDGMYMHACMWMYIGRLPRIVFEPAELSDLRQQHHASLPIYDRYIHVHMHTYIHSYDGSYVPTYICAYTPMHTASMLCVLLKAVMMVECSWLHMLDLDIRHTHIHVYTYTHLHTYTLAC